MTPTFTFGTGIEGAAEASRPTCNPCRENDCSRCPTVLAQNDVIDSDFECACFHRDPEEHEAAFAERQEKRDEGFSPWDDHGPMAGSYRPRGYYASSHREYERWAGDLY